MSAEIHCTTHPSPRPCASIYIRIHAGGGRSGSTESQELRSCWSAGCPLLPSTYFHRLATKQLNVRNPETRSGLGTLALIQLDETDSEMDLGVLDLALLFPSRSAAPRAARQELLVPPALLLPPTSWRREGRASRGWGVAGGLPGAGGLQVMSCCPVPFCQPPEEGSWFPAPDTASLGCISGSETRSRAPRHISRGQCENYARHSWRLLLQVPVCGAGFSTATEPN